MTEAPFISSLAHSLAVRNISVPKVVMIQRWVSLVYQLSEADIVVRSEVRIRPGQRGDIDFFAQSDDVIDPKNTILRQIIKFWDQYGFRCLYVGYPEDESRPGCMQFWIDQSDKHRFTNMEYGAMYQPLNSDTIYAEAGYVRKDLRGRHLFRKFRRAMHKELFLRGKKFVRSHIASNNSRIPSLRVAAAVGFMADHWISMVKIRLPFCRSNVFVHHPIKDSDLSQFPLNLFKQRGGS